MRVDVPRHWIITYNKSRRYPSLLASEYYSLRTPFNLTSVIHQIQAIYLSQMRLATSILISIPLFGLFLLVQATSRAPVTMSESRGNLLVSVGLDDGLLPQKRVLSGLPAPPLHPSILTHRNFRQTYKNLYSEPRTRQDH